MNTAEMEERLRKHADEVKSAMAAPFDEKRGELYMTNKRLFKRIRKEVLLIDTNFLKVTGYTKCPEKANRRDIK